MVLYGEEQGPCVPRVIDYDPVSGKGFQGLHGVVNEGDYEGAAAGGEEGDSGDAPQAFLDERAFTLYE